jgi:hypothetical protein
MVVIDRVGLMQGNKGNEPAPGANPMRSDIATFFEELPPEGPGPQFTG